MTEVEGIRNREKVVFYGSWNRENWSCNGSWNRENWSCNGSWNRDIICSTIKEIGLKYETKDIRGTFAVEK